MNIRTIATLAFLPLIPLAAAAQDPRDPAYRDLIKKNQQLHAEIAALEAAQTLEERFLQVRNVFGQVCFAMEKSGKDSAQTAGKIKDFLAAVRVQHGAAHEILERVGKGLQQAGESMTAVSNSMKRIDQALDLLEIAVRARNTTATGSLQAFQKYFNTLTGHLGPVVGQVPGMGAFIRVWSDAIGAIASDAARIEAERDRRHLLARELTGRELYIIPRTEREALHRALAASRRELAAVERALKGHFPDRVEDHDGRVRAKDDDDVAMERARAAAERSAKNLSVRIEEVSGQRGRIHRALGEARRAHEAAKGRYSAEDRRTLDEKADRLEKLGPDAPYRDPANANDAQKHRARERWFAQKEERARLRREIMVLVNREQALQDAQEALRKTIHQWNDVDAEYRRLEESRTNLIRRFMQEEALKHRWSDADLRRKYPNLF